MGPRLPALPTVRVICLRHVRRDARGRQAIEDVALGADIDVSTRHGEPHDLAQDLLDGRILLQLECDPRLRRQGMPTKYPGAHRTRAERSEEHTSELQS